MRFLSRRFWRGLRQIEQPVARRLFNGLRVAPLGAAEGIRAGTWRRELAARGVTLHQIDCLIAAAALAAGVLSPRQTSTISRRGRSPSITGRPESDARNPTVHPTNPSLGVAPCLTSSRRPGQSPSLGSQNATTRDGERHGGPCSCRVPRGALRGTISPDAPGPLVITRRSEHKGPPMRTGTWQNTLGCPGPEVWAPGTGDSRALAFKGSDSPTVRRPSGSERWPWYRQPARSALNVPDATSHGVIHRLAKDRQWCRQHSRHGRGSSCLTIP